MNLTQQQQAQQWLAQQAQQRALQGAQQQGGASNGGFYLPSQGASPNGTIPTIQYPSSAGGQSAVPGIGQFLDQWTPIIGLVIFVIVALQVHAVMKGKNGKDWSDLILPGIFLFGGIYVYSTYLRPML